MYRSLAEFLMFGWIVGFAIMRHLRHVTYMTLQKSATLCNSQQNTAMHLCYVKHMALHSYKSTSWHTHDWVMTHVYLRRGYFSFMRANVMQNCASHSQNRQMSCRIKSVRAKVMQGFVSLAPLHFYRLTFALKLFPKKSHYAWRIPHTYFCAEIR